MSCSVVHRLGGSGVVMVVALIQPLAWEPPYAVSVALKYAYLSFIYLYIHKEEKIILT